MPDPRRLDGQRELERELPPVVALEAPNGKGEGAPELVQEGQAGPVVQPPVQPQDTEPRAIIQGRVLKRPPARNFDKLDVDLDGLPGLGLFEELQLSRRAFRGPPQVGHAEVPEGPLDRAHGEPDVIRPQQPEPGPCRPIAQGFPRIADVLEHRPPLLRRSAARIPRHQPGQALGSPAHAPAAHRSDPTPYRRAAAVGPSAMACARTASRYRTRKRYRGRATLSALILTIQPLLAVASGPSQPRGSILSRYFTSPSPRSPGATPTENQTPGSGPDFDYLGLSRRNQNAA